MSTEKLNTNPEAFCIKFPPPKPAFPSDAQKVHPTQMTIADDFTNSTISPPQYKDEKITNPTKRGATFRKITTDFLSTTNMHALPHVGDAPFRYLRWLWLIIFIVMCVLLALHVRTIVRKFYAYPTLVTMKIKREDTLEFPAVTVCNQNPVPRSILEQSSVKQIVKLDSEMACGRLNGTSCKNFIGSAKYRFEKAVLRCYNETIKCKHEEDAFTNSNTTDATVTYDDDFFFVDDYFDKYELEGNDNMNLFNVGSTTATEGNEETVSLEDTTVNPDIPDTTEPWNTWEMQNDDFAQFDTPEDGYDYYADFDGDLHASDIEGIVRDSEVSDLTDVTNLISIKYHEILSGESGTKIEDFILECSYDRQSCEIGDNSFKTFYNKAYGKCYTFNSKLGHEYNSTAEKEYRLVHARRYGSEYGLRLTLNINQSEYVGLLASSYGARITISSPTQTPYPHLDGFDALPGMVNVVAIKKTYIVRLPEPFESKCFDEIPQEYTKHGLVEMGISYSLRGCRIACMDAAKFQACGCIDQTTFVDPSMYDKFETCNVFNSTQRRCRRNVMRQFQVSNDNLNAKTCHCSAACNETSYRHTLSMSKWPTRQFVALYINNMPRTSRIWNMFNRVEEDGNIDSLDHLGMDTVERNLVRLHVYYEELNYEYIQENEAYGLANLFADLGGVIGLYLGLSVSTVLEVFQYFGFLAMFKCYRQ